MFLTLGALRHSTRLTICLALLALSSCRAYGGENGGGSFIREAFGVEIARAGRAKPSEDGRRAFITVAVIVDGEAQICPVYCLNDPDTLGEVREQLRRFDEASFEATLVSTPDLFPRFFYAPASEFRADNGIAVTDLLQSADDTKKRLPKQHVHHKAGGRGLEAGTISITSRDELPETIEIPTCEKSGPIPRAAPSKAHFIIAYGDSNGVLRAAYVDARDVVPLVETVLGHATLDERQLNAVLLHASYLAARSSGAYAPVTVVLIVVGAILAIFAFVLRYHRGKVKRKAERRLPEELRTM